MKKSIKKQIKEIKTMIKYEDIRRQVLEAALRSNDVGRILRTFKIKKNVEVTDNGKIII